MEESEPVVRDTLIRPRGWLDLGNDDPRMPPAFMLAFSARAFSVCAFRQYEIALPERLENAVPRRQAEFLAGRLAARQAIERLGIDAVTPDVGRSREPLWQAGVTGSISHTAEIAGAVAVDSSRVNGVGMDIENLTRGGIEPEARALVVTPEEQTLLETQGMMLSSELLFTLAFSAKESFFKGTFAHVGHYFDFKAVRISSLDTDIGRLTLMLVEPLGKELTEGREFPVFFKTLSADTLVTSFIW